VALLWSSRKPGRLRYLRRAGLGVATVVGALWVVVPLAVAIGATHRPRAAATWPPVHSAPGRRRSRAG
jgi:hypothetical protein